MKVATRRVCFLQYQMSRERTEAPAEVGAVAPGERGIGADDSHYTAICAVFRGKARISASPSWARGSAWGILVSAERICSYNTGMSIKRFCVSLVLALLASTFVAAQPTTAPTSRRSMGDP